MLPARIVLENGPAEQCFATIVLPFSESESISAAFVVDASMALALLASSYDAIILTSMALTWSNIFCSVRTTFACGLLPRSNELKFFLGEEALLVW